MRVKICGFGDVEINKYTKTVVFRRKQNLEVELKYVSVYNFKCLGFRFETSFFD